MQGKVAALDGARACPSQEKVIGTARGLVNRYAYFMDKIDNLVDCESPEGMIETGQSVCSTLEYLLEARKRIAETDKDIEDFNRKKVRS